LGEGRKGNNDSDGGSISADGRLVAFHSAANNLSRDERSRYATDVYIRDLRANTTTLVSRLKGPPRQSDRQRRRRGFDLGQRAVCGLRGKRDSQPCPRRPREN
jgi:hypothetical protein